MCEQIVAHTKTPPRGGVFAHLLFDDCFAELAAKVLNEGEVGSANFVRFDDVDFLDVW